MSSEVSGLDHPAEGVKEEVKVVEPTERPEESKFDMIKEKAYEPTRGINEPEQSKAEIVTDKEEDEEKMEALYSKEVKKSEEKEPKVSESECNLEEASEKRPVDSFDGSFGGTNKNRYVPTQSSVEKTLETVPHVTEKEKGNEGESVVAIAPLVDTAEQEVKDKVSEIPPNQEGKKIKDDSSIEPSDREIADVEKKFETEVLEKQDQPEVDILEKSSEPEKEVKVPEQSSIQTVEDGKGICMELPAKVTESTGKSEGEAREISDVEPVEKQKQLEVETVKERLDEPEKVSDVAHQSSIECVLGKEENVEELSAKELEAIEDKKVEGSEYKPESSSETVGGEKLQQPKVQLVEEKQEEPVKVVSSPIQPSVDIVEENVENQEKLPVEEVKMITEKEVGFSKVQSTERPEESKVDQVEEKAQEPTKVIDVVEQSKVEAGEDKEGGNEKVEPLYPKEVKESEKKEQTVSETACSLEETSEKNLVESFEESSEDRTKIIDDPKQSSVEKNLEPGKEVEAVKDKSVRDLEAKSEPNAELVDEKADMLTTNKELEVSEVEHKPEISDPKPREQATDVPEQSSLGEKLEKMAELNSKEVEAMRNKEMKVADFEDKPKDTSESGHIEKLEEPKFGLPEENMDELPTKAVEKTTDKDLEVLEAEHQTDKIVDPKSVVLTEEMPTETAKVADVPEQSSIGKSDDILETNISRNSEQPKIELVAEKPDKPTTTVDIAQQSLVKVPEENVEKAPVKIVEETVDKDFEESKAEPRREGILDPKLVESAKEAPTVVKVPEAVEEQHERRVEEQKDKELEISEDVSKPEEISDPKPFESVEEMPTETKEVVDVQQRSPMDQTGDILGTNFPGKLEEPKVELLEDKPDKHATIDVALLEEKPDKHATIDVTESLVHVPDEKKESVEEFRADLIEDRKNLELQASEAEHKPEEISFPKPADSVEEVFPKTVDVVEQSQIDENLEEIEKSPVKDVGKDEVKEKVSEDDSKFEETLESNISEKLEGSKVELVEENKNVPLKIIDAAEQPSTEAYDEKEGNVEKIEELPTKKVEETTQRELTFPQARPDMEDISESIEELPIHEDKPVDPPEQPSVAENLLENEESSTKKKDTINDKEEGVSEAGRKLEDISRIETKNLGESGDEFVEQTQRELTEENNVREPITFEKIEDKVEKVVEPDAQEVKATSAKEDTESKAEMVDEKLDEPLENVNVSKQYPVGAVEGKVSEEVLPKEVEAAKEEEHIDPEAKGFQEMMETAEKQDKTEAQLAEEKFGEQEKVVDLPDQPSVVAVEDKVKTEETFPMKEDTIAGEEVKCSESVFKPEDITGVVPVKPTDEDKVEPEKFVGVEAHLSAGPTAAKQEKAEELPNKKVQTTMDESKVENISDSAPTVEQKSIEKSEDNEQSKKELSADEPAGNFEQEDEEVKVLETVYKPEDIAGTDSVKLIDEKKVEPEKLVELDAQGERTTSAKEDTDSGAKNQFQEISETDPAEIFDESKAEMVDEKLSEPIQNVNVTKQYPLGAVEEMSHVEELLPKEVEADKEAEKKAPESKVDQEMLETAEKDEKSEAQLAEAVEDKVKTEAFPVKENTATAEEANFETEFNPEDISGTDPAIPPDEMKIEPARFVDGKGHPSADPSAAMDEKGGNFLNKEVVATLDECKVEDISDAAPTVEMKPVEKYEDHTQAKKELPADELAKNVEGEVTVANQEVNSFGTQCKPENTAGIDSVNSTDEKKVELEKFTDIEEQPSVGSTAAKQEKVEELPKKGEAATLDECKVEDIPDSVPSVEKKELPAEEPTKNIEADSSTEKVQHTKFSKEEEPIASETQVDIGSTLCYKTDEMSEITDVERKKIESVKKPDEVSEERTVEPEKVGIEIDSKGDKVEENQCYAMPIKDISGSIPIPEVSEKSLYVDSSIHTPEVSEKSLETASKDLEPFAENGSTKDVAACVGNGDEEASKEAEKCEPEKKTEGTGRSLKDKMEQEKKDHETSKIAHEHEEVPPDEVSEKSAHKHSNNIMKMVKHSLAKAKKAITGKSSHSKSPVSEIKGDDIGK